MKQSRLNFLLLLLFLLDNSAVSRCEKCLDSVHRVRRNPSFQEEHVSGLRNSTEETVFLRSGAVIIGDDPKVSPYRRLRPDLLFQSGNLGFLLFNIRCAPLCFSCRNTGNSLGRSCKSGCSQSCLDLLALLFQTEYKNICRIIFCRQNVNGQSVRLRGFLPDLCVKSRFIADPGNGTDERCRFLRACKGHRHIEFHPRNQSLDLIFISEDISVALGYCLFIPKNLTGFRHDIRLGINDMGVSILVNQLLPGESRKQSCFLRNIRVQYGNRLVCKIGVLLEPCSGISCIHLHKFGIIQIINGNLHYSQTLKCLEYSLAVRAVRTDADFLHINNSHAKFPPFFTAL